MNPAVSAIQIFNTISRKKPTAKKATTGKTRKKYVKFTAAQWEGWTMWLRDHGKPLFINMDPEYNTQTLMNDTWDASFKKCQELGIEWKDKQAMKDRFRKTRRRMAKTRNERKGTGKGKDDVIRLSELTEPEEILDYMWFTAKLGNDNNARVSTKKIQICTS